MLHDVMTSVHMRCARLHCTMVVGTQLCTVNKTAGWHRNGLSGFVFVTETLGRQPTAPRDSSQEWRPSEYQPSSPAALVLRCLVLFCLVLCCAGTYSDTCSLPSIVSLPLLPPPPPPPPLLLLLSHLVQTPSYLESSDAPSARTHASSWVDAASGHMWLFGGEYFGQTYSAVVRCAT